MPKKMLTGSLEEQCTFLYQIAQEKMAVGNYTGAHHALQEIAKYAPDYRDVPELMALVRQRKAEQRFIIVVALLGSVAFVGLTLHLQLSGDLWKLLAAVVGLLIGYGLANFILSFRQRSSAR
jgi:hypothetical protein